MKAAVWKYELGINFTGARQSLDMPSGAAVLSVGNQNDRPVVWVLVDPRASLRPRSFLILGTGRESEDTFVFSRSRTKFIGTVLLSGGADACHIFEVE